MEQSCVKVLESKINSVSDAFNKLSVEIEGQYKKIEELKTQIATLLDEQKRLQGEYRALTGLLVSFSNSVEVTGEEKDSKEFSERILD